MELVEFTDKNGDVLKSKVLDGVHYAHHVPGNVEQQLTDIVNMTCLVDDIIVAEYPKSGFHWIQDILYMIRYGKSDYFREIVKIYDFIPISSYDDVPSPRVFLTHFLPKHLPKQFLEGRGKLIFLHRNPKDCAVSLYKYIRSLNVYKDYKGSWDGFIPLYISGRIPFGAWYDYMTVWREFLDRNTDKAILIVSYEEMHKDLKNQVKRIAEFLDANISEELVNEIVQKCSFKVMKDEKEQNKPELMKDISIDGTNILFRKGVVGDWRNCFTEDQLALFHSVFDSHIQNLGFNVQFTI